MRPHGVSKLADEVPLGPDHLGLRAFALLAPVEGKRFVFTNRIPLASGLGSSAATIAPLNPTYTAAEYDFYLAKRPGVIDAYVHELTIKEGGYPSKMLSCSLRLGPTVDGETRIWHLEEKAGGNIVVTLPPPLIDELLFFPTPEKIVYDGGAIWKDFPEEVMSKLLRVPYFARAYDEDGYARDEYNTHPALVKTAEQFSKATNDMVEFAGKCLEGSCFAAPTPA